MGLRLRLLGALLLAIAAAMPAMPATAAGCDIGGRDNACATRNGHYRIRTPEGRGPWPTVVYLYGSLGISADVVGNEGFVRAFTDRGYAVIVPAALDLRYSDRTKGSGWHLRNERIRNARDETAFIGEVLKDAALRHGIDRKRVLIAGMSRGGFLTWDIACHAPRLAAAYAPVAAGYLGAIPERCAAPVRLLHTHGRGDPIVPLAPGRGWRSGGARMEPLAQALDAVARAGNCVPPQAPRRFLEYDRSAWDCPQGSDLQLMLHDGGHIVPLSWFSAVIDWFEGGRRAAPPALAPASPRFVGSGERGDRFRAPKVTMP